MKLHQHFQRTVVLLASQCALSILVSAYYLYAGYLQENEVHSEGDCGGFPLPLSRSGNMSARTRSVASRPDPRALVLVESQYSPLGQDIISILESGRFQYHVELAPGKGDLPALTEKGKGKYSLIVYENILKYVNLDSWNQSLLDKYCAEYSVGVIGFHRASERGLQGTQLKGFPLSSRGDLAVQGCCVNPHAPLLRMTKLLRLEEGSLPGADWTVFQVHHSAYQPVILAKVKTPENAFPPISKGDSYATVFQNLGLHDGIRRVLFGNNLNFWLHKLIFIDAVSFLSGRRLTLSLDRYLLVDIDDIFMGKEGTQMNVKDVKALLETQSFLRTQITNFTFNLGFSGKFYHIGTEEEDEGDDLLLRSGDAFWWFPHTWSHMQPHLFHNESSLVEQMALNKEFALVLPRQTCGLLTHTIFHREYPGGPEALDRSIQGGELFFTFVLNPISIFMTHLSYFSNDRLGSYIFVNLANFVQRWTHLRLQIRPPLQLARKYFALFPEQRDPLWQNPCDDKRHRDSWSKEKCCDRLPKFLVIGPQKTGTTALCLFLVMHPSVLSNSPSHQTLEEVQFFNRNNYHRGLIGTWISSRRHLTPPPTSCLRRAPITSTPRRPPQGPHLSSPKPRSSPSSSTRRTTPTPGTSISDRSHEDPTALRFSFQEVILAGPRAPAELRALQTQCLVPGWYTSHLKRWLLYFPPLQQLRADPAAVMEDVQRFLGVARHYNYSEALMAYRVRKKGPFNLQKDFHGVEPHFRPGPTPRNRPAVQRGGEHTSAA